MSFGESDFTALFWPFHEFNVREWQAGRVPLWNNSIYGGQPHLAGVEAGVFYPLSLVELLLAGRGGILTGIFTRMLLDTSIAAIGMYFLVRRLTADRAAAALSGVAFAFSGFMLGYGANQVDRLEALVFVPLGLFFTDRALCARRPALDVWLAGASFGCTLVGGYPQMWLLLPPAVLALVTWRWLGREEKVTWARAVAVMAAACVAAVSLAAAQLIPALEFLQNSDRSVVLGNGGGYSLGQLLGFLLSGADGDKGMYAGIAPLALALVAAVAIRRKAVLCWLAAAAFGLLLAMGDNTPLYDLVFARAGFGLFRAQHRDVALTVLCLAVLAGFGLAALNVRLPKLRWIAPALVTLAALDLLITNWDNNWPADRPVVPVMERSPHVLAALHAEQRREPMRFVVDQPQEFFPPNESFRTGLESVDGYLNFKLKRTYELLNSGDFWRQWQLFNVREIVSRRDLARDGVAEVPDARDGPVRLFKMEYPLPRAHLVWQATVAGSPQTALKATLDPAFDPGTAAVLERPLASQLAASASGTEKVAVDVVSPEEVRIAVTAPADGLLVISEPYYPGWTAAIDGRPASIERADYAFEAVPVPAGEHQVLLKYEPASFRIGAAISLLSLAGLLLFLSFRATRGIRAQAPVSWIWSPRLFRAGRRRHR